VPPETSPSANSCRPYFTDEAFRKKVVFDNEHFDKKDASDDDVKIFSEKLFYQDLASYDGEKDIKALGARLKELDENLGVGQNYIFYLSTPPKLYSTIPSALAKAGLNENEKGWARLIVEKPFGYNEESAIKLNKDIQSHFRENTIYRIDHYLGKETVQNLLVTRFANGFFEPLWNRNYVQSVQITAAETVGVGSRGGYYDESGAMRDMVQNHLLQVLAHVAMEPPIRADAPNIRDEKLKLFRSLRPITKKDVKNQVVRAQYTEGKTKTGDVVSYRDAEGVPNNSKTETFVGMKFFIDNWRWAGVPSRTRLRHSSPNTTTSPWAAITNSSSAFNPTKAWPWSSA
jgi:glucose-6-phosphate 1-dehydrogenase